MGRISKGILGGFSGKVGQVVGGNWKGIDYMRSNSGKRTGTPTQAQADQQEKFALAVRFMQSLTELVAITFKSFANRQTAFNGAVSYTLQNAITGTASPFGIDYSLVLVSRGDLPNAQTITAIAEAGNKVKFTWQDNSGTGTARATDKAIAVVYCPALNQAVYLAGGAARSALQETITADNFAGQSVETWLAFITEDGKKVSASFYSGQLTLLP